MNTLKGGVFSDRPSEGCQRRSRDERPDTQRRRSDCFASWMSDEHRPGVSNPPFYEGKVTSGHRPSRKVRASPANAPYHVNLLLTDTLVAPRLAAPAEEVGFATRDQAPSMVAVALGLRAV